jgi:hypothetical protein
MTMVADLTSGGFVGLWVVLWYAIFIAFAFTCFRKRHLFWFILGFFLPFCWLIGALLPDRRRRREERREDRETRRVER